MGKPPLTDEERRIKDLIRELHEEAQAALAAAKELRAARDGLAGTIEAVIVDQVNERTGEINDHLDKGLYLVIAMEKAIEEAINQASSRVLGFTDYERALERIGNQLAVTIASPQYIDSIAKNVVQQMNDLLEEEVHPASRAYAIRESAVRTMTRLRGPGVTVMDSATAGKPPGLYDENMQPLNIRIVPLSV